jgi:hypothetical protein
MTQKIFLLTILPVVLAEWVRSGAVVGGQHGVVLSDQNNLFVITEMEVRQSANAIQHLDPML